MIKTADELQAELKALGVKRIDGPRDLNFFCPSVKWLEEFGQWLRGEFANKKWTSETFDCDDYAIRALDRATESLWKADKIRGCGHAFCYVDLWHSTIGRHAMNIVRCEDEWQLFEPQNGQITPASVARGDGGFARSIYSVWL